MKSVRILVLFALLMPILCSTDKKSSVLKRLKKFVGTIHDKAIHTKDTEPEGTPIEPETPLHLSGEMNNNLFLLITDETINAIKRGKDYYYKWVFTYKKEIKDKIVNLSEIELDHTNSKFLFSSNSGLEDCGAEKGVEHSYADIKDKCIDEYGLIKGTVTRVKTAKKIFCEEKDYGDDYTETVCKLNINDSNEDINQQQSVDEMKYKLNNIRKETYSPTAEFVISKEGSITKVKGKKMMEVRYREYTFSYTSRNVTITDKGNYTEVEYKGSNSNGYYYLCLASDCKYVCKVSSSNYEDGRFWNLYNSECYVKSSDFDGGFNSAFNKMYITARDFNPNSNSLRRSLLEEAEEENKKEIKEESTKAYYYEEAQESYSGYYKGYFLIGNELTIIQQKGQNGYAYQQRNVVELKLVLTLDSTTKSVKVENLNDEDVDQTKSGVEAEYYEESESDPSCKAFIPLKDSSSKFSRCGVNINTLASNFIEKDYNISGNENEKRLTIYNLDSETVTEEITLKIYDNPTKLIEIINSITKFTLPIPNDRCLRENYTTENSDSSSALYNRVLLVNEYNIDKQSELKSISFSYSAKTDGYYYTEGSNYYIRFGDNQYLSVNEPFFYKHVNLKGNDYVDCNVELKNNELRIFEDRISEVRREEGIDDGSVKYVVSMCLVSLLFIIFM